MTLHKLIGRKSETLQGFAIFGISTMEISFTPSSIILVLKNSLTIGDALNSHDPTEANSQHECYLASSEVMGLPDKHA